MAAAICSSGSTGAGSGTSRAVVCGAGVIGTCTAYFLGKRGVKVTVVDSCGVATAASGKAGGFLALDWCDGSPVGNLARASFALHRQLADELGGETNYGYRRLDALSVTVKEPTGTTGAGASASLPSWIDGAIRKSSSIGSQATTAQVHPQLFTRTVMSRAESDFGAEFLKGTVREIRVDPETAQVSGVVVDDKFVEAETVVIALGPWCGKLKLVTDLTSISGLKAHSIILQPREGRDISPHALFLSFTSREGETMDPEVYPRPTGEVYVCGMSEHVELPPDADHVEPKAEAMDMLKRVAGAVSSQLDGCPVKAQQACFLPLSVDGVPLIGKLPHAAGVYLATGHSCWGILNAPATGASLAELIVESHSTTVDLKPFDPARFLTAEKGRRKFL
ncbi:hypothetical protein SELMODRAFT_270535 [Selaginella moellendorffii]|uniref:FAD dependent oxidoreductase domain-containing protein n=1 Tax=Selaginella moellendorffii TaxID=88036 RepID=D8R4B5_SELML|nr:putative oxidoreductase TDA3 [Selaginella moellendorffii]EFJ33081.1 hypothetical protein SELMODRAFT_270535 [Selaginella moellendorffii]|eukprot:XP_024525922.1 putative oxidoreductase TDA3 [Selaginella moellendorffii]